jgi:hypothetical protein
MATLTISYFGSIREGIACDPIKAETVTTSTSSAASGAIPANAKAAVLHATVEHYATIGTGTPTAAIGNSFHVPANQPVPIHVNDVGGTYKIAAITLA